MGEFEKVLEGCTFLKNGPSGPKVYTDTDHFIRHKKWDFQTHHRSNKF